MNYRYTRHYTRDEARALLPQIREWLQQIKTFRSDLEHYEKRLSGLNPGHDVGGDLVNNWIRTLAGMQEVLIQFQRREILIKDIERGLLDFPAIIGGQEVLLCWEQDEEDIEFWHDLDSGYGGRERL